MAKNEAKIRFTAETGEFTSQVQKANSTMQQLRAEMKLNEAQMKANGTSVEGLEEKYKILSNQYDASKSKVAALQSKLDSAIRIFGEGSTEVDKWRTQLLNAQTAQVKIEQAMNECTAEIKEQRAAMEKAETAMDSAENAAETLDDAIEEAGDSAKEASEGFTVMKGALADMVADGIEAAIEGLANIGAEAFTMANDIDSATNTFIAKTGESVDSAEEFEGVMTDIYNNNFGESFDDIAESMATVRTNMGDMDNGTLQNMTEGAILLRDTFDFDVNESTRAAKMLMDQFGMSGTDAYNLIAQGAQNGLNKNGDLMDILTEYSVQFKDAGYSAEDMFNMLANGTEAGTWSVDKLGDAVKEFNIRAKDGTVGETIKENAKAFGLTATEAKTLAAEVANGNVGAYQKLKEKLAEVDDDTQRYQLGVEMFGTMWEDLGEETVMALLDTQGEISTTEDALGQINAVKYDDLGSAIEGIKRNLQTSVSEPIKNEVMPAVNEFVQDVDWEGVGQTIGEVMSVAVDAFFSLVDGIKQTVQWMSEHKTLCGLIATAIGVVAVAIGAYNVVNAIQTAMNAANVTTVWELVAAHAAQAVAAMAAIAPYILVVAAIAAVIAIIVLLIKNWDDVVAACKNMWEKVKETLSKWGEWIDKNVIQPVVKFFKGLWEDITKACSTAWDWVKEVFASFVEWVNSKVVQPIVNFFTGLWNSLKSIWDGICNVVQFAFLFIGEIISAAVQIITAPFRMIWEVCKSLATAFWNWISPYVTTAINAVKTVIQTVLNTIKTVFSTVWNTIKSVTSTVWNAIKSVITTVWNAIKSTVTTVINAVKNTVSNIWNSIKSVTSSVWNSVKSAISSVWNSIKSAVTSAIENVKSKIQSVWDSVKSVTTSAWNAVKTTITNVWNNIKSSVSNAINNVKSVISSGLNAAKSTISNVLDSIKSKFTSIWDNCKSIVSNAINKIKGFFNFNWSLPKIKLPHFSISGKFSLNPPSVPHFSIDWYKDGAIFTKPTLFNTPYGLKGVGEAGAEAVLPIEKLEDYISGAIEKAQNVVNLNALATAIEDLANRPINLNVNGRTFAVATAGDSDSVNGFRSTLQGRGLTL